MLLSLKNYFIMSYFLRDQKSQYCIMLIVKSKYECNQERGGSSHLRYIRLELREMHQMLIKEDLLPDLNEAKEVLAQLDALLDLLSEKRVTKIKSQF